MSGALDANEVSNGRRVVLAHLLHGGGIAFGRGRVQPAAAHYLPELAWLFAHPQIIRVAREALGTEDIVFTGHSDLHLNHHSSWHKDSGSAPLGDPLRAYFPKNCSLQDTFSRPTEIVKVAVYLQPTDGPLSLRVDSGSHRRPNLTIRRPRAVPTDAGDLVVFDVRLTHAGSEAGPPDEAVEEPLRVAAFITFGVVGPTVEHFALRSLRRQRAQLEATTIEAVPSVLRSMLARAGVRIARAALLHAPEGR